MNVPDRAVIPLLAAVSLGFLTGLLTAIQEMSGASVWAVAVPVGALVAISGIVSVVKAPGEESERWIVGGLRALCAVATFGFLVAGFIRGLRDGNVVGLLFFLCAVGFGVLLTRFRVRDRGELDASRGGSDQGQTSA